MNSGNQLPDLDKILREDDESDFLPSAGYVSSLTNRLFYIGFVRIRLIKINLILLILFSDLT